MVSTYQYIVSPVSRFSYFLFADVKMFRDHRRLLQIQKVLHKLKFQLSEVSRDKIHEAFLWQFGPLFAIIIQLILFLRCAFARP